MPVSATWHPRLCAISPIHSVTHLGLPSLPEPAHHGIRQWPALAQRMGQETLTKGKGEVTAASAWSCWRCHETAPWHWSSLKRNPAWEFHWECQHSEFVLIFCYGWSLSSAPFKYGSSMDPTNSLAASCFCCAWKSLIIQFYAVSKLRFIFLYFIVVSHPLWQTLCSFPSSLISYFLKILFLLLRSITCFNHVGLLFCFLWIFFIWCWAYCRVSLNNFI